MNLSERELQLLNYGLSVLHQEVDVQGDALLEEGMGLRDDGVSFLQEISELMDKMEA